MATHPTKPANDGNPKGFVFELTGGALCLDLVNSVGDRPAPEPLEHLNSYEELIDWGLQTGELAPDEGRRLRRLAARHPRRAAAALGSIRGLRESLFRLFSEVAAGHPPPETALAELNRLIPGAMSKLRLEREKRGVRWVWAAEAGATKGLDFLLAAAVDSAAELLTSPDLDRVRLCESETCAWLFLDRSKNRSRRWCDMTTCGNRAKARRHYERTSSGG